MATVTTTRALDRRGKTITTFVAHDAAGELAQMADGEVLELLTDDFEPFESDIAVWADQAGHRLLETAVTSAGSSKFLIEKGTPAPKGTSMAMVVSTDKLEELLSPLGFALAAALEGMQVDLFLQGPAVRILKRGFQPKMRGIARVITRFAAAGMTKTGHIPAQEKLQQLHELGARIHLCGPSMEHFRVKRSDLVIDGLPLVEYLTVVPIMERADVTLYT